MSVKINHQIKGFVKWGKYWKDFYLDMMEWRRKNYEYKYISIYYNIENNEVNIMTDAGRIMMPIFKNFTCNVKK